MVVGEVRAIGKTLAGVSGETVIAPEAKYNGSRYVDYEFEDETSQFDPEGRWNPGGEYYSRTYRCRVPRKLLESKDESKLSDWIANHSERGIWR